MKIIDLLTKIANGEDVPKKIKYRKCIFEYEEKYKEYFTKNDIIPTTFDTNGIFRNIFLDYNNCLNDEIEIIEENKKIEHIGRSYNIRKFDDNFNVNGYDFEEMIEFIQDIYNKVEEIIDKINKLGDK